VRLGHCEILSHEDDEGVVKSICHSLRYKFISEQLLLLLPNRFSPDYAVIGPFCWAPGSKNQFGGRTNNRVGRVRPVR
jgi:hypothetical protein